MGWGARTHRPLLIARPPRARDVPAGSGVWGFTFDPLVGEFILSHPDIKIPDKGVGQKIYSFNEGNYEARRARCAGRPGAWHCPALAGLAGVWAPHEREPSAPASRPSHPPSPPPAPPTPLQLWTPEQRTYIDSLKQPGNWGGKPYSARYIGSLVGDFHRTLLYGGIYGYPGDSKNPNGKLRLLYECAPMSMLAEQVRRGGAGALSLSVFLSPVLLACDGR